jgi:hypothetical protein
MRVKWLPITFIMTLMTDVGFAGVIHRFVDSQGILHISSVETAATLGTPVNTAQLLGVQDPFSPQENILGGCRYFRYLLNYFQGSVPLALAAYNAGSQRVIAAGYQVPRIKETQSFVTQVMALYYLLDQLSAL